MTDPNRWGIIFNSRSGSRHATKRWRQMRRYMEAKHVSYDFVQSEGFGSVSRLTRMLCDNGYRTIVLVGGDGSLYDALNAVLASEHLADGFALGIIPNGIGNDFAAFWDIDTDNWRGAIDNLIARRTRKVDVGFCKYADEQGVEQTRYFIDCVNIGLGARLVELTNGWMRLIGSKRLSLLPVFIAQIFERKSFNLRLQADALNLDGEVMSLCIGNATGYGQTPNAVPYNGRLDMSIITRPAWWQLFEGFWLLGKGQFLNYKNVHPHRVSQITVGDIERAAISLDGTVLKDHPQMPLTIGVLKEHIDFIVP